ncbi:MAG: hypothetical protein WBP64_14920 [Nitrososphaeraceae archaeon]
MSYEQAFNIIKDWLDRSCKQRRLDFYPKKGYFPIKFEKLKIENNELHNLLERQKISKGS